jgi:hypothetical protein
VISTTLPVFEQGLFRIFVVIFPLTSSVYTHYGPVWHSSASPVELFFFRKQLHEQLHEWGRELCFGSFTMCLTL